MRLNLVPAVVAALVLCGSASAAAQTVCIERSPDDALADNEWTAARALLAHSINRTDLTVVDAMCSRTWTVAHVSLGDSWTVLVSADGPSATARASGLDELERAYAEIVTQLVPEAETGGDDPPGPATARDLRDKGRISQLFVMRTGVGGWTGRGGEAGTMFGFGYRHIASNLLVDVGIAETTLASPPDEGFVGSWLRLSVGGRFSSGPVLYPFFAAGLGFGSQHLRDRVDVDYGDTEPSREEVVFTGVGPEITLSTGIEVDLTSSIHVLIGLHGMLPAYTTTIENFYEDDDWTGARERAWVPTARLTMGIAFGTTRESD